MGVRNSPLSNTIIERSRSQRNRRQSPLAAQGQFIFVLLSQPGAQMRYARIILTLLRV